MLQMSQIKLVFLLHFYELRKSSCTPFMNALLKVYPFSCGDTHGLFSLLLWIFTAILWKGQWILLSLLYRYRNGLRQLKQLLLPPLADSSPLHPQTTLSFTSHFPSPVGFSLWLGVLLTSTNILPDPGSSLIEKDLEHQNLGI